MKNVPVVKIRYIWWPGTIASLCLWIIGSVIVVNKVIEGIRQISVDRATIPFMASLPPHAFDGSYTVYGLAIGLLVLLGIWLYGFPQVNLRAYPDFMILYFTAWPIRTLRIEKKDIKSIKTIDPIPAGLAAQFGITLSEAKLMYPRVSGIDIEASTAKAKVSCNKPDEVAASLRSLYGL